MPEAWSKKREKQYEDIRKSQKQRGTPDKKAKEIAARTVNKNRAQAGEARQASRTSTQDKPASKRGGERSHSGAQGRTKAQLYEEAKKKNVSGRSSMSKSELEKAVGRG